MYAIRSYYGILFWSFTSLGFIPAFILGMEWFVSVLLLTLIIRIMIAKLSSRITSYNVCYTKLLRQKENLAVLNESLANFFREKDNEFLHALRKV